MNSSLRAIYKIKTYFIKTNTTEAGFPPLEITDN